MGAETWLLSLIKIIAGGLFGEDWKQNGGFHGKFGVIPLHI